MFSTPSATTVTPRERPSDATLDTIAAYRAEVETEEPLPFGVWGEVAEPGRVRLGDEVVPED